MFSGGSGWLCCSCFVFAGTNKQLHKLQGMTCRPLHTGIAKLLHMSQQLGHQLSKCTFENMEADRPMFVCRCCGLFASRQFRGLMLPCSKRKSQSWHRIFKHSMHPNTRQRLLRVEPMSLPLVWDPEVFVLNEGLPSNRKSEKGPQEASLEQRISALKPAHLDDPEGPLFSDSD